MRSLFMLTVVLLLYEVALARSPVTLTETDFCATMVAWTTFTYVIGKV